MKMKKDKDNLFYDYLLEKMREHVDISPVEISYKKAKWILSRFRIPNWLSMPIIREMIKDEYLFSRGRDNLEISKKEVDLDRINCHLEKDLPRRSNWTLNAYREKKNGQQRGIQEGRSC